MATISICIPQYNRSQLLLCVLRSIEEQTFRDIEVVISDDHSTDDSAIVIPEYIATTRGDIKYLYSAQAQNMGYDINLRTALSKASGEYLLILGNDDAIADPEALSRLVDALKTLGKPEMALVNQCQFNDRASVYVRCSRTQILGEGPAAALTHFRRFSIVCGLIFLRKSFLEFDTSTYDRSVFFQVFLACRILASGGRLGGVADVIVAKDVFVNGKGANSYRDILRRENARFEPKTGGIDQVAKLARDAIVPFVAPEDKHMYTVKILCQLLRFSYPYWLVDYRKRGVFRAALNLAAGCYPGNLYKRMGLHDFRSWRVIATYSVSTVASLVLPVRLLTAVATAIRR